MARELCSVASEVHVSDRNRPNAVEVAGTRSGRAISPPTLDEESEVEKYERERKMSIELRNAMTSPIDYSAKNHTTNLHHHTGLSRYDSIKKEIAFNDGTSISLGSDDVIVWCTGYKYAFEFLPDVEVESEDCGDRAMHSSNSDYSNYSNSSKDDNNDNNSQNSEMSCELRRSDSSIYSISEGCTTDENSSNGLDTILEHVLEHGQEQEESTKVMIMNEIRKEKEKEKEKERGANEKESESERESNPQFVSPPNEHIAGVWTNGRKVRGLYQHVFAAQDPTLAFLGLPFSVVPFPLFHLQATWLGAVIKADIRNSKNENEISDKADKADKAVGSSFIESAGAGAGAGASISDVDKSNMNMNMNVASKKGQVVLSLCDVESIPPLRERLIALAEWEDSLQAEGAFTDAKYHHMGSDQWEYCRQMACKGVEDEGELLKALVYINTCESIYNHNGVQRPKDVGLPDTYRKMDYEFLPGTPQVGEFGKERMQWTSRLVPDKDKKD